MRSEVGSPSGVFAVSLAYDDAQITDDRIIYADAAALGFKHPVVLYQKRKKHASESVILACDKCAYGLMSQGFFNLPQKCVGILCKSIVLWEQATVSLEELCVHGYLSVGHHFLLGYCATDARIPHQDN